MQLILAGKLSGPKKANSLLDGKEQGMKSLDCILRMLSSFVKIRAGNSSTFILFLHESGTNATVLVMDCPNCLPSGVRTNQASALLRSETRRLLRRAVMAMKTLRSESVIPDGALTALIIVCCEVLTVIRRLSCSSPTNLSNRPT